MLTCRAVDSKTLKHCEIESGTAMFLHRLHPFAFPRRAPALEHELHYDDNNMTAALRPDNRKLHPRAVISWELLGFAPRRADDGRLIEGLYQGIKKGGRIRQASKAFFPRAPASGWVLQLKAEQPLRLNLAALGLLDCGSLITEALAPASAARFCVEERLLRYSDLL
ncbi:hypothetical protein MHYP_G00014090 [Metynnis hypsauchen]